MPPFKNLRGFARRKSQGNSIDESSPTAPPPVPPAGFRVIPRDEATRKSVGGIDPRKPGVYQPARQSSSEYESNSSNRGSNSSAATSGRSRIFDDPNTRLSSSSTLQSPVEAVRKDRSSPSYLTLAEDLDTSGNFDDIFAGLENRRSRIINDSPVLPPVVKNRSDSEPVIGGIPRVYEPKTTNTPPPPGYLRKRESEQSQQSPYSWNGRTSNDGLMSSPTLDDSPEEDDPPPPPVHKDPPKGLKGLDYLRIHDTSTDELIPPSQPLRTQNSFSRSGVSEDADAKMVRDSVRAVRAISGRQSMLEGSPLARTEKNRGDGLFPHSNAVSTSSSDNSLKTPSMSSSASSSPLNEKPTQEHPRGVTPIGQSSSAHGSSSNNTTPRAMKAEPKEEEEQTLFDPSIVTAIRAAETRGMLGLSSHRVASPTKQEQSKVMTAAQFKALKQKENMSTINGKDVDSGSEDGYEDDEDDAATQAQKRKIQAQKEAQHTLWRQKMKKDIGDHTTGSARPGFMRGNQSAPNLSGASPSVAGASQSSSDDEDIPLAILHAHNFPSKNPPDPRHSANSFVGARPMSTFSQTTSRPGTPTRAGANANQRRSNLPVFAQGLPADLPYLNGGDLVNPSARESLQFNKSRAQSVYGGAAAPTPAARGLPPNGLIGVIQEEERQRALRRGSPNGAGIYSHAPSQSQPAGLVSLQAPQLPMGGYGMPTGAIGFNPQQQQQQMFMEFQKFQEFQRWQQMMGQMGGQPMQMPGMSMMGSPMTGNQMMGMQMMGSGMQQSRPMSMATNNPSRPGMQSRTMSMVNPSTSRTMSMANFPINGFGNGLGLQNTGYAPSVAPSERSNIGQPSRYKPVSSSHLADGGSTITAGSTIHPPTADPQKKKGGFLSAMMHSGKKGASGKVAGDDDEEDWGNMARRRRG